MNFFIDQGKFEAVKTLNGCTALCCGKHQLRAKVLEPFSSYHV